MNTRSLILSTLIAGLVMALLSNIPVINFANCLLCMWVWLSGILAVFLYRRFEAAHPSLTNGQGAALGALAGVFGALIGAVVGAFFGMIFGASMASAISLLQSQAGLQESMGPYLDMLRGGAGFTLFGTLCNLVLYAAFGAIGGLIATALIWKTPQTTV